MSACANCGEGLHGEFCAHCGQRVRDLRRPLRELAGEALDDLLHLDARAFRTIGPLLLKPGEVMRAYRAGHRMAFVPPLRAYLVAALVFFGLFSLFPAENPDVVIVTTGSPEAAALERARAEGEGPNLSFEFPAESRIFDDAYQKALERAKANPGDFLRAVGANVPRTFFVLLPAFALVLELFYRKQGYYVEHLVFSLYFHAFVFSALAVRFVFGNLDDWMPAALRYGIAVAMWLWMIVYLPLALRRVYGGSWPRTLLKWVGLGVVYLPIMALSMVIMMFISLARF